MRGRSEWMIVLTLLLSVFVGFTAGHLAVMSVDLGSEYMKIAIVKPGVPMEIITNEDSSRKTATMVALRNGERFYGNTAEATATKFPSTAFWYLTQIIGKKYDDPAVAQYQKRFPYYNLVKDEDRDTVLFQIDEETLYSPEELIGMILEKARQYAETFADQPIKDVVITVPTFFNQAERRAMMHAAELSGLNVLQLMSDNAAVALNYGVFRRKQFTNVTQYFMFYDMGATSTTATIVSYQIVKMKEGTRLVENPQLTIKGVGFDKDLGGLEISMRLRDHLAKYFNEHKKTKMDLYSNQRAMAKLLKEAKRVKKVLSANQEHQAQIEGLLDDEDFRMTVTRTELEDMCADMFAKVTKPIQDALKASEVTLGELTDVILMGGGTRIPKVQKNLVEFLGRKDLGKSINTDEAAALGAVYQAAHLGKGFKVMTFNVKEATIYPVVRIMENQINIMEKSWKYHGILLKKVEFEKYRAEESTDLPKVIKRTLFGRMNPYPQRKVMTFNKHFKDFYFNVTYGDLDFLPEEEIEIFRKLQGQIHNIGLKGVEDAYSKHKDAQESKGIKAHFKMDESGILTLEHVESVFEKDEKESKEESTWSKLGDTISGLFGSNEEGATVAEEKQTDTKSSEDTTKTEEPVKQTDQSEQSKETGQSEEKTDAKKEDVSPEEDKQADQDIPEDEKKEDTESDKPEEQKDAEQSGQDKQEETTSEPDNQETEKKETASEEKADKKKEKNATKEEGDKKPKVLIIKENITAETEVKDVIPPTKDKMKAMKKKLADLTAKDKEKKLLEKAKNELESFTYDMGDKLSQEVYEACSTEEEREKLRALLSEASDWLYEQEEDAKKEVFTDKLKSLKKEFKGLEYRVSEYKERPEALAALDSMLNHSSYFLSTIKNLTALNISEESIFTAVETETLEKLINDTEEWKAKSIEEQSKIPDHEKPKLLLDDIGSKIQALDREVKYLINKAKTYKPKSKPKTSKNSTSKTDKNETVIDSEESTQTEDIKQESTSDIPETPTESEIPTPPTEDTPTGDEQSTKTEDDTKPTEQPQETNTHDAGDL